MGAVVSVAKRTRGRHQNYISQKSIRGRPTFLNVKFGLVKRYHHFRANLKIRFSSFQERSCVFLAVLALSVNVSVYFTSSLLSFSLPGPENANVKVWKTPLRRMRLARHHACVATGSGWRPHQDLGSVGSPTEGGAFSNGFASAGRVCLGGEEGARAEAAPGLCRAGKGEGLG